MGTEHRGGLKLLIKGSITSLILVLAIWRPEILVGTFTYPILFFKVYHVIWIMTMWLLLKRMIPQWNSKISMGKIFAKHYPASPAGDPAKQEKFQTKLTEYTQHMNSGALRTAIYWVLAVIFVGILHYTNVLNRMWVFLTVVFFIFMDQFCVSVWCVFKWIIGNKCCNTCRINNWGYLMAFSTLIYIPSFWTYSVLVMSIIVVVQWEYLYAKYPERFYELFNTNLQCRNCDGICKS